MKVWYLYKLRYFVVYFVLSQEQVYITPVFPLLQIDFLGQLITFSYY